ncbi:MAG: histidine phosphatase family protein [Erysipelotrichaceae bacterium]|nr:histidine phosphatase family protein [Erysipelotrichaceae bacterium]
MKHIITVQHAQSVHHTNGMVGSWTDWDLTELGKKQADNIGKKLKEELSGKDAVMYSSDLKRARQTAEEIAKYLDVKPILRQELRERNLGKCCGKSIQWLRENMEHPENTVDDRLFSDGESIRDAWNRLRPFFEEVMASEDENIIIVSHGDLLSIWNTMFLELPIESYYQVDIHGPAGGVSHMIIGDDGKRHVRHINDMSYIADTERDR